MELSTSQHLKIRLAATRAHYRPIPYAMPFIKWRDTPYIRRKIAKTLGVHLKEYTPLPTGKKGGL